LAVAAKNGELRLLWFMQHSGYLRFFAPAVRLLAERGHTIHLGFSRPDKDPDDTRLLDEVLATYPNVTAGAAPVRRRGDGWRLVAELVRSLIDVGRYVHPRYADAPALRARMAQKLIDHVHTARAADPVTQWLTRRVVRFMDARTSERLSRRLVGFFSALERAIPTSRIIDKFLRDWEPHAVLVTPVVDFSSPQVEFVKSARKLGIASAVTVASWDNLTGKGLIRVIPDFVLVWNDTQVEEAVELHRVPRERIVVTGACKFDDWFGRSPDRTFDELASRVGLAADKPFLLYVCSAPFIAPEEVGFVRTWLETLRADGDPRLREIGVLVRPHPRNAPQWENVDLSTLGNASIWPRTAEQPDVGAARSDFFDSLFHCSAVVGLNTSALIDAAIVGRSVFSPLAPDFEGTQRGTLHFHYLLFENGGFLHTAETLEAHCRQLRELLDHGDAHAAQTRAFVASFVRPRGLDRPATPILADEIEAVARAALAPRRRSVGDYAARALLAPAAFAAGIVGRLSAGVRGSPHANVAPPAG
jgi:hypothetical protein